MNRTIQYFKRTDYLFGPFLLKLSATMKRDASPQLSMQGTKHILIIRPGGIGDAALLMPSLKTLREMLPKAKVDILCEPRNFGVFLNSPFIDQIFNYRKIDHIIRLKQTLYDIVFDTEQSHFLTGVIVATLNSRLKVGFATQGRESVYDLGVDYSHNQYEAESFFRLFAEAIEGFPVERAWDFPYFFPSVEEREKVNTLMGDIKEPVICLFPGASIKERLWPADRWAKVVAELWEKGCQPILLGGEGELQLSREIAIHAACPVLNFCGKLSLRETAVLFERTRLLVSTDSGILHLAVVCDIPTVSLFGPGIAAKWAPTGDHHIAINKGLECSPCTRFGETPHCPREAECLQKITTEEVMDAALKLAKRERSLTLNPILKDERPTSNFE